MASRQHEFTVLLTAAPGETLIQSQAIPLALLAPDTCVSLNPLRLRMLNNMRYVQPRIDPINSHVNASSAEASVCMFKG